MRQTILAILALALVATGCRHTSQEIAPAPLVRTVRFDSEPPGAFVTLHYGSSFKVASESAGEYLGKTPCAAPVAVERNGTFAVPNGIAFVNNFGNARVALFVARLGERSVTNIYKADAFARNGDPVPASVLFRFPQ
jgi:hypothetical protein